MFIEHIKSSVHSVVTRTPEKPEKAKSAGLIMAGKILTSRNIADRQIFWEEIFNLGGNFWCQRGNLKSLNFKNFDFFWVKKFLKII